jgi:hypothetical protein
MKKSVHVIRLDKAFTKSGEICGTYLEESIAIQSGGGFRKNIKVRPNKVFFGGDDFADNIPDSAIKVLTSNDIPGLKHDVMLILPHDNDGNNVLAKLGMENKTLHSELIKEKERNQNLEAAKREVEIMKTQSDKKSIEETFDTIKKFEQAKFGGSAKQRDMLINKFEE